MSTFASLKFSWSINLRINFRKTSNMCPVFHITNSQLQMSIPRVRFLDDLVWIIPAKHMVALECNQGHSVLGTFCSMMCIEIQAHPWCFLTPPSLIQLSEVRTCWLMGNCHFRLLFPVFQMDCLLCSAKNVIRRCQNKLLIFPERMQW